MNSESLVQSLAKDALVQDTTSSANNELQQSVETKAVLHLINGEHFSGAERVQDLLGQALPASGFDPHFACLKLDQFDTHRQSICPLYDLEMRSRFDFGVMKRAAEIVKRIQPVILHAHTPRSALVGSQLAAKFNIPFVYHVHSPTSRDSTKRLGNWINQKVESRAMKQAQALIPVSTSLRLHLRKLGIADEKIFVVPNGVDSLPWTDRKQPDTVWTLGTVALFRQRKGTEVLLDALAILHRRGVRVQLIAVGGFETTEYETFLKQKARDLGIESIVEWTGFCQDVNEKFQLMDVMVLPSLFGEGLPMVVLEAMTNGIPVVATSVEGVPEAIRDGRDGLLALPGDAKDLAKEIQKLVSGEVSWESIRKSAFDRQLDCFSTTSMASGVANVYRHILERNAALAELPKRFRG